MSLKRTTNILKLKLKIYFTKSNTVKLQTNFQVNFTLFFYFQAIFHPLDSDPHLDPDRARCGSRIRILITTNADPLLFNMYRYRYNSGAGLDSKYFA